MTTMTAIRRCVVVAVACAFSFAMAADEPAPLQALHGDPLVVRAHADASVEIDTGELVSMSRERVRAELQAAETLGLLMIGEGDLPRASGDQKRLIAEAGDAAIERLEAARREMLAVQQWIRRARWRECSAGGI